MNHENQHIQIGDSEIDNDLPGLFLPNSMDNKDNGNACLAGDNNKEDYHGVLTKMTGKTTILMISITWSN